MNLVKDRRLVIVGLSVLGLLIAWTAVLLMPKESVATEATPAPGKEAEVENCVTGEVVLSADEQASRKNVPCQVAASAVWVLDNKVWWLSPKPVFFKALSVDPCSSPDVAAHAAERIFVDIYGNRVLSERPWRVTDTNGNYFIRGSLPKGHVGGVAQLKIKKANGSVCVYLHGK